MADPGLEAQRDRLIERFAVMQSELGGLFYEMAIRDHVKLEVLVARAAALQLVDTELAQVEALLRSGVEPAPGTTAGSPAETSAGLVLTGEPSAPGQATVAPSQ